MKVLYVARIDENYGLDFGVSKKINGQISAFEQLGCQVDYLRMKNKQVIYNDDKFYNIKYRYFAYSKFYRILKKTLEYKKYDFVYLRYCIGDINFYKSIKLFNKLGIKVVIEIPTYPYLNEKKGLNLKDNISVIMDKYISKQLKKYVYRISVTNTYDYIYGIKTINIYNGIDLSNIPLVNKVKNTNQINMIGIANLARWHGYDRVIKGLYEYYKNDNAKNIHFYIVGDGREKENLIDLTSKLNLNEKVHFLGSKNGKELDCIFDNMDIGVSSLALFRAGGGHDPIKSKEFLGRGIPTLMGYHDKVINMNLPYVYKVEENDSIIDINNIISRYNKSKYISPKEIRQYAEKNLSWKIQMKKVIEQIQ